MTESEPTATVHKFRKGEQFQVGTSPRIYTATKDESARGIVYGRDNESGRLIKFYNLSVDTLTLYTPEPHPSSGLLFEIDGVGYVAQISTEPPSEGNTIAFNAPDGSTLWLHKPEPVL